MDDVSLGCFVSSFQGPIHHLFCQNFPACLDIYLNASKWSVRVWMQPVCFWQSFSHYWPTPPVADGRGLPVFGGKQLFLPSLLLCITSMFTCLWLLSQAKCSLLMLRLSSQDQLSVSLPAGEEHDGSIIIASVMVTRAKSVGCDSIMC